MRNSRKSADNVSAVAKAEKYLFPFSECRICTQVPNNLAVDFTKDQKVPKCLDMLDNYAVKVEGVPEGLCPVLKRCPYCGIYYLYETLDLVDMEGRLHETRFRKLSPDESLEIGINKTAVAELRKIYCSFINEAKKNLNNPNKNTSEYSALVLAEYFLSKKNFNGINSLLKDKAIAMPVLIALGKIYVLQTKKNYKRFGPLLEYLKYSMKKPDRESFIYTGRLLSHIAQHDFDIRKLKSALIRLLSSDDAGIISGSLDALAGAIYGEKQVFFDKREILRILPYVYCPDVSVSGPASRIIGAFVEPRAMEYDFNNAKFIYENMSLNLDNSDGTEAEFIFKKCRDILKKNKKEK